MRGRGWRTSPGHWILTMELLGGAGLGPGLSRRQWVPGKAHGAPRTAPRTPAPVASVTKTSLSVPIGMGVQGVAPWGLQPGGRSSENLRCFWGWAELTQRPEDQSLGGTSTSLLGRAGKVDNQSVCLANNSHCGGRHVRGFTGTTSPHLGARWYPHLRNGKARQARGSSWCAQHQVSSDRSTFQLW